MTSITLGTGTATYDLLHVPRDHWISPHLNLLGHGHGILAQDIRGRKPREIPPAINLAIVLTLIACQTLTGAFFWQPKRTQRNKHLSHWAVVPDLIYYEIQWTPEEALAFRNADFCQQRDFLCANTYLHDNDVVLPFVLDLEGVAYATEDDARVTAEIDGQRAPMAAISIPGQAFVGWYSQMIPNTEDLDEVANAYLAANGNQGPQWKLSARQKELMRCYNVEDMYKRILEMNENPENNALVIYHEILELVIEAERIDRTGSSTPGEVLDSDVSGDQPAEDTEEGF